MKRCTTLLLVALGGLVLAASPVAASSLLFEDQFDGPQYADDEELVLGPLPVIDHGYWSINHSGTGKSETSTARALSGTRSLALIKGAGGGNAQVIGYFSPDGETRVNPTAGFTLRFAFQGDFSANAPLSELYIDGASGQSAYVTFGGSHSEVQLWSEGSRQTVTSSLQSDTWYYLELQMPSLPGTQYTVSVFESDGSTLVGTATGALRTAAASDYHFFTIYHAGENYTLYLDNVTVSVPEPSTAFLGALTLIGWGGMRILSRRRSLN